MKLKLYAKLHDIFGKNEIILDMNFKNVGELKKFLKIYYKDIYDNLAFVVCNGKYLDDENSIQDCDEILLFPSFSGG